MPLTCYLRRIWSFANIALKRAKPCPRSSASNSIIGPNHRIIVDGRVFKLRGVTYAKQPLEADFRCMAEMGVNAVRTWGTNESTPALLDLAQKYGIKILLGIWMRHGRCGNEGADNFDWINDNDGKKTQRLLALAVVRKYKDHPSLLGWSLGNEVTLNISTDDEKIAYARYLEEVAFQIRKIDPNHIIASVSAWTTDIPYWVKYCDSIDLYGINAYGYGVYALPMELKKLGISKPYFLGEFGVTGEWSVKADSNGVKVEPKDSEKYEVFAKHWSESEAKQGEHFCGGFLFNFGNDLDFGGIWLNFFIHNLKRPSYWGARKAFSGKDPVSALPIIESFVLINSDKAHSIGSWMEARMVITNPGSHGKVSFQYNQRNSAGSERNGVFPLTFKEGPMKSSFWLQLPMSTGGTKIYAFYEDNHCNLAIASSSVKICGDPSSPSPI